MTAAHTAVRRVVGVLVVGLLATASGGCTSDDPPDDPSSEPSASASATLEPAVTVTTMGRITGKLPEAQRLRVKEEVATVIDGFLDNAYLGEFPRPAFAAAYRDFTSGARKDALEDAALLSNADISAQIDTALATKRRVFLEVFAPGGQARGVTARFVIEFQTSGSLERTDRVKGKLLMMRTGAQWEIFGYDLIRSVIS